MENNLQNKAMFFAAYLFQSAVTEMSNPETITPYFLQYADLPIFQVELKFIDNITDEDVLHIATSMYTAIPDYQTISNGKCMVSCHENQIGLGLLQSDYLRSKGYALPWMGLSVEKLVEYGWVKLK